MPRGEMERYVPELRNSTDFRAERGVTLNVRRAMQAYRALSLIDHVEKDVRGAVELTFRCAAQLLGVEIDACQWQGRPLWSDEYVLSADEKTSIQCVVAPSRPCRLVRIRPCASNTSTSAVEPSSTWRPGMSISPSSLAAASRKPAKPPTGGWSTRLWGRSRIGPPVACFGLSTTVRRIAASLLLPSFESVTRALSRCTHLCMRVGSIRSILQR